MGVVCHLSHDLLDDNVVCSPEGVDLPEASLAAGATACSLEMPRSCDEGLELWGGAPMYPDGSGIRVNP
ncbi:hypothetical protein CDL15_Pgr023811 [Punica granatum]|nr:hypothetical protein CDL15_Pgr023811 [Punica granatum]